MSNLAIPQIAITPEPNEWNSSTNNIADTLTDVEDLEEGNSNKIKSKLKIKLNDDGGTTDVEDLETSDIENDVKIPTVSLDDLHLDSNFEENVASTFGNISQSYTLKSDNLSVSPEDGITDTENVATDDEPDFGEIPEPDINFEDYPSDYINISSHVKQKIQFLASPFFDVDELTDVESVDTDEKEHLLKKTKTKRRKSRSCYRSKGSDVDEGPKFKRYTKMKKSLSHPVSLKQQNGWLGFESDGDMEENSFFKGPIYKKEPMTENEDLEGSKSNNFENKDTEKLFKQVSSETETETDTESFEGVPNNFQIPDIILPPPVRIVIVLNENKSVVPTTKILPLDETRYLDLVSDEQPGGTTDTECFVDDDDLLSVDQNRRGPTPEVCLYETSSVYYGENQLNVSKGDDEPTTDVEDLAADNRPKRTKKSKNKTLNVVATNEPPTTDSEDFYMSDTNKSPLKRQNVVEDQVERSVTPYYIKETDGMIISSKDSNGTSTTRNLLNTAKPKTTSNLTDVEDLLTSADEDVSSDAGTPNEFSQHLDQQRSSRVHIETTRKLDLNSPNEIMYLKGGSYRQSHTDVEEMSNDSETDSVGLTAKGKRVVKSTPG